MHGATKPSVSPALDHPRETPSRRRPHGRVKDPVSSVPSPRSLSPPADRHSAVDLERPLRIVRITRAYTRWLADGAAAAQGLAPRDHDHITLAQRHRRIGQLLQPLPAGCLDPAPPIGAVVDRAPAASTVSDASSAHTRRSPLVLLTPSNPTGRPPCKRRPHHREGLLHTGNRIQRVDPTATAPRQVGFRFKHHVAPPQCGRATTHTRTRPPHRIGTAAPA